MSPAAYVPGDTQALVATVTTGRERPTDPERGIMAQTCPMHAHPKLFDGEFFADPYKVYAGTHQHEAPNRVCFPDGSPVWMVTRYQDVHDGLRDRRLARPRDYAGPDFTSQRFPEGLNVGGLVYSDPPEHTRLRRFVSHAFLPKNIEKLRPRIYQIVHALLDDMSGKSEVDLVNAFAVPLPVALICGVIGIPEEYWPGMKRWADASLGGTLEENAVVRDEVVAMVVRLREERRVEPADDLISHWLTATDKEGNGLTVKELGTFVGAVLFAGFDTTAGTISNAILTLLDRPEVRETMMSSPEIYDQAVEELIRHGTAVHNGFRRFATEDVEIGGTRIGKGDTVFLNLAAANRDPSRFDDPDLVDIERPEVSQHIAFGGGPHFCTGADLGRLEVQVALRSLFERFPDIALAVPREELRWRHSPNIPVLMSLPVTL